MTDIAGFHHVNLSVADRHRSARWYAEVLGFVTFKEMDDDGRRGAKVVMRHPRSGILLGFTTHAGGGGGQFDEARTGLDHLAFSVPDRSALTTWMARLDHLGVAHSLSSTGWLVTFRDPDNIQLQVYALEG
ncbi:MAG: VOC family protein [Acidimicrobiales bacterium]